MLTDTHPQQCAGWQAGERGPAPRACTGRDDGWMAGPAPQQEASRRVSWGL